MVSLLSVVANVLGEAEGIGIRAVQRQRPAHTLAAERRRLDCGVCKMIFDAQHSRGIMEPILQPVAERRIGISFCGLTMHERDRANRCSPARGKQKRKLLVAA